MSDREAFRQEEIDARKDLVLRCQKILTGELDYLEGVLSLLGLQARLGGVRDHDEDFMQLTAVVCDTEHLPLPEQSKYWSADALQRIEPEIELARKRASVLAPQICERLIARFGEPNPTFQRTALPPLN